MQRDLSRDTERLTLHWLTQITADLPKHNNWLSKNERATLADKHFLKRRADWRLGRWTAKRALLAHLAKTHAVQSLCEIEIRAAVDGAPEAFLHDKPMPVTLSISHSRGVGFCVVAPADVAVGCDLELVEFRSDAFISDYFTLEEKALVLKAHAGDRPLLATLIWSAKESALKALRQGLRRDTRSVHVQVDLSHVRENWSPLTVRCEETARSFHGWWRCVGLHVQTVAAASQTAEPTRLTISSIPNFATFV